MTYSDFLIVLASLVGISTVFAILALICDYFEEKELLDFYNTKKD